MKIHHAWILYFAGAVLGVTGAEPQKASPAARPRAAVAAAETGAPRIVERWGDGRVWERVITQTLTNGKTVLRTNRWTDLATGMHYRDENQWKESRAEIVVTRDGAEARQGPHKVHFAGNINTPGAITIQGSDDQTLRAHVVGLAYTDLATGESVLLASVHDAEGQLLPPNQVVYLNAFSGLLADLRYTYTRQGFEQDVILREEPAPPSDFGLNNDTTALEVWTEFDAPEPQKQVTRIGDLPDETLSFGKLRIAQGKAFALDAPDARMSAAPVGKTWLQANGRQYLIESVRRQAVEKELSKLPRLRAALPGPGAPAGTAVNRTRPRLALLNQMPPRRAAAPTPVRASVDKAVLQRGPALVLDYIIYGGDLTNFTFQTDSTYLISDSVNIWGDMILEGGTVIKIGTTNDTMIAAYGDVVMRTEPYRPAIITSQNDATVGLDFTAPGSPMKGYGGIATAGTQIFYKHLRLSNLGYALSGYSLNVSDVQFVDCTTALYEHYNAADIDNVLIHRVERAFAGSAYTLRARHVTIHDCDLLTDDFNPGATRKLALTNSLLVNVGSLGVATLTTNCTVITSNNPFQTVGAGAHYLADPSPYRDIGTTNIPATLAARLKKTTTYPPLVLNPHGETGVSQTLSPRCGWDTDKPDLGYHYNPLDYAITEMLLTNATLTVAPGTAIGFFSATNAVVYGLGIGEGASLRAEGRADAKVQFTHFATVQEMATTTWNGPLDFLVFTYDASSELRCRFTDFTTLARSSDATNMGGAHYLLYGLGDPSGWHLTDSQFFSGQIVGSGAKLAVTNSLFHRVYCNAGGSTDVTNRFYDCTFSGGSFNAYGFSTNNYRVHDTLFSETAISADVISSHIGYVGSGRLAPNTNLTDRVLTGLVFQAGSLGYFYISSNALVNAGSRNATNAGLYHYTMLTNNVKETNTVVDIGFHYVATSSLGVPLDYDGDGVPDYWEDLNGNGGTDSGETDWRNANDSGLRIFITRPRANSVIP